jgi:hypothetical protein
MAYERFTLIVDDASGALGPLSLRLMRMGIDTLYTNQRDEAALMASQESRRIGALLLPMATPPESVAETMAAVANRASLGTTSVIMVGSEPDIKMRINLRSRGVRWWIEPEDDAVTIRSLITFVMSSEDDLDSRIEPRVPALLMAEVDTGTGTLGARVRNLSVGGAFLELDQPVDPGTELKVAIALDDERLEVSANVAFQVAPSPDHPEGIPSGVGVAFGELDLASQAVVRRFLADLLGRYQL